MCVCRSSRRRLVGGANPMDLMRADAQGQCRLEVAASNTLTPDQLRRLFDIVPGLEFCDRDPYSGESTTPASTNRSGVQVTRCFVWSSRVRLSKYPESRYGVDLASTNLKGAETLISRRQHLIFRAAGGLIFVIMINRG